MENKLKTGYGYCRVSTDEQAKTGYSIEAQKKSVREHADKLGILLLDVFVDEGESATVINRPGFLEMLNKCEEKPVDAIIVWQTDRFARNEVDHFLTKDKLNKLGIAVLSVAMPMLDDSPEGKAMDGMMAVWNAYFSRDLSRKTKKGLMQKWDEGWWPGWAPLGYKNDKNEHGKGIVVIDPITGPLIKWAFYQYATGRVSLFKLIKTMHKKGLRTRNGKPIAHSTMHQIIINPFYYGWMRWNGLEKKGNHTALIKKELYDLCQVIAAKHRNFVIRERKHDFLLRGFIFCSRCGHRYTAEWHNNSVKLAKRGGKIAYYHCAKKSPCKSPYAESEELEKKVAEHLKNFRFSKGFTDALTNKVKQYLKNRDKEEAKERKALLNKRQALLKKRQVLEDSLLNEDIQRDTFKRLHGEIEVDINTIDEELAKLQTSRKFDFDLLEEVLALTRNIPKTYKEAPVFLKRRYLNFFFEKIEVDNKNIVNTVFSPLVQELISQQAVILRTNLLRDQDSNLEP